MTRVSITRHGLEVPANRMPRANARQRRAFLRPGILPRRAWQGAVPGNVGLEQNAFARCRPQKRTPAVDKQPHPRTQHNSS